MPPPIILQKHHVQHYFFDLEDKSLILTNFLKVSFTLWFTSVKDFNPHKLTIFTLKYNYISFSPYSPPWIVIHGRWRPSLLSFDNFSYCWHYKRGTVWRHRETTEGTGFKHRLRAETGDNNHRTKAATLPSASMRTLKRMFYNNLFIKVVSDWSGELSLLGLWKQESHQSSGQQQSRHQQHRHGAVRVHQLPEGHVTHDGRHSAHSCEETESRGPERQTGEEKHQVSSCWCIKNRAHLIGA